MTTTDHVSDAAGRTGDDVLAVIKLADIFPNVGAADTCVDLDLSAILVLCVWGGGGGSSTLRYSPRARMTD